MSLKTLEALVERGLAAGAIVKGGGGWLSFGEHKLGQGAEKAAAALADKPDLVKEIEAALPAEGANGGATTGTGGKPPAEPPKSRKKDERRAFKATSLIRCDGDDYQAGDDIELTHAQWQQLRAGGAIEGDWED